MIRVTPIGEWYVRVNQDCDEQQAILSDMQRDPQTYLRHADGVVRGYAALTRGLLLAGERRSVFILLAKLHCRLRELA